MKHKKQNAVFYALALILGALCFVAVYGVRVLNPTYDEWLLGRGDLTQHYLGWCFYRRSDWTFPVGLLDTLAYPDYSSVIFTDSIPLLALFFKLLAPVLPDTFQYFGWWGLACFMLQGLFAVKILRKLNVGRLSALIGSILFILSPIVIERMFRHTALGGHWIILASIYLFMCHKELYNNIGKTSLYFGLIGAYVGTVHMYFLPMCGAFVCGFVLSSLLCGIFCEKTAGNSRALRFLKKLKYLLPGVSFAVCLFVSTWLMGGFSTRAVAEAGEEGITEASFNLNGFFNPKGYSRFLPSASYYYNLQYEGFAYLGLGVFALLALSLVYIVIKMYRGFHVRESKKNTNRYLIIYAFVYAIICVGLITIGASPRVTYGEKLLFTISWFENSSTISKFWAIFRSSGRFVWPVCYLIYIVAVVCADRLFAGKRAAATAVLAVCVIVQLVDISGKLEGQWESFSQETVYESPLQSELWDKLSQDEELEHVIWVSHIIDNGGIMHIAKFAYDNGLTMNNFYFARGMWVMENTMKSLADPSEDTLYIFSIDETEGIEDYGLNLYEADGYILGTVKEIAQ